ncbi:MAG: sortase [Chloroflexota bacterium]
MKLLTWNVGIVGLGATLFLSGAGMRVCAQIMMAQTEARLLQSRPDSPADLPAATRTFTPADNAPTRISIPALGLWNTLTPVDEQAQLQDNTISLTWAVADSGWYSQSGWPGWGGNVVIAGHSPSQDPDTWSHSIFRQLAYLSPGDHIDVTAGSHLYTYSVSTVFAIPAQEAQSAAAAAWLARGKTERLTLITCWPPNTAAYRVVVIARPIGLSHITEH